MIIPGILAQRRHSGGAPAAFPVIRTILETNSAAANHVVTITAADQSVIGDRMIVLLSANSNAAITPPAGWTFIAAGGLSSSIGLAAYYRDKTVDAVSVSFGVSGSANVASVSLALTAGTFAVGAPVASALGAGFSSASINPPAATDGGGVGNQLVIAFGAHRSGSSASLTVSSYPLADNQRASLAAACAALLCTTTDDVSTYDPGAFVVSTAADNRSVTVMQRAP